MPDILRIYYHSIQTKLLSECMGFSGSRC